MAAIKGLVLSVRLPLGVGRSVPGAAWWQIGPDLPRIHRGEVRFDCKARIPGDLARATTKTVTGAIDERHEPAMVSGRGHQPVSDDHLMIGIHRDLAVIVLDEAVAGRQDATVGVGKGLLRTVGRTAILRTECPALPAHARRSTGATFVVGITRIDRLGFQSGLGSADLFQPTHFVRSPIRQFVTAPIRTAHPRRSGDGPARQLWRGHAGHSDP